jgi:hypothetical protein
MQQVKERVDDCIQTLGTKKWWKKFTSNLKNNVT